MSIPSISTSIETRQATLDDHEDLVRFTLEEAEEAEGRSEPSEVISKAIKGALSAPDEKARYYVAHTPSGELLGHVSVTREWSDWNNAHYLWITSMFVTPGARGRGVMSALIESVDQLAREIGAPEVRIYVHKTNQRATRAWTREGFTESPYWMGSRQVKLTSPTASQA